MKASRFFAAGILAMGSCLMLGGSSKADTVYTFNFTAASLNSASAANLVASGNVTPGKNATFNATTTGGAPYLPLDSVTATGFNITTIPDPTATPPTPLVISSSTQQHNLYIKTTPGSPDETGLGLLHTPNGEIGICNVVELNFNAIFNNLGIGYQAVSLNISSVQAGEGFLIYGSNAGSVNQTYLTKGDYKTPQPITLSKSQIQNSGGILYVTAWDDVPNANGSNNVLIQSASITAPSPSPSPSSTPLPATASTGLALLGGLGVMMGANALRRRRQTT